MKTYIANNKSTVLSLGFAGVFFSLIAAVSLLLGEVSPAAIL